MIKSIRLRNFKAFEDTGILNLSPITVLAGPNSGGKSSILQSLLLLKQTLDSPADVNLSLDGRHLQFSSFREVTFGKPTLSRCNVTYEIDVDTPMPSQIAPSYFSDIAMTEESNVVQLNSKVALTFQYNKQGVESSAVLGRFEISSLAGGKEGPRLRGTLRDRNYRVTMRGKGIRRQGPFRERRIKSVGLKHFLPYFLKFEEEDNDVHTPLTPVDPIFLNPIRGIEDEIEDNLEYLGPLRERPRRAYVHSGNAMTEIGESGQHAAQILWLEKDDKIGYLPTLGQEPVEVTLMEAVNDAILKLGMFQPVDVRSEKSIMYQILFRLGGATTKEAVTIADVGFGVSQMLPILVLGLRSCESSILLLEQPEIHLHPKLQANLADFLLTLAQQGKRLVVETHSDHFINRLRRRIAEDTTDELRSMVNILFVHPPSEGRGAVIEPLGIDRYGIVENWPPGFLPEAADEAEAIFLASLRKRKGEQDVTDGS